MRSDNLRLGRHEDVLVARLSGEIDLSNAEQLGEQIADATPSEYVGVALDLTEVSHIDSYGLYVMFGLRERLAQRGQALALVLPRDSPVQPALRLANVVQRMEVAEAVDDALRTLRN